MSSGRITEKDDMCPAHVIFFHMVETVGPRCFRQGGGLQFYFAAALIGSGIIRQAHQVIHTDAIKYGKRFHYLQRGLSFTVFITGICLLATAEVFSQFLLLFIVIFTELSQSQAHIITKVIIG